MSLIAKVTIAALSVSSLAAALSVQGCSAAPAATEATGATEEALLGRCPVGTAPTDCGYYDIGPTGKPILSCICEPVPPSPEQVAVGGDDGGCILFADGSVQCWAGFSYEMTDAGETLVNPTYKLTPVTLPAAAVSVAAGTGSASPGGMACAVLTDHTVWCWGANTEGELGNASLAPSPVPVEVLTTGIGGLTPLLATQVASKSLATCAVTTQGGVSCWGDNAYGELGNASVPSQGQGPHDSDIAVPVGGLPSSASSVTVGITHACALLADGSVYCWGDNGGFQGAYWGGTSLLGGPSLGIGAAGLIVPTAARVQGLPPATALSAGYETSCATAGGELYCWGMIGEVSAPASATPVVVSAASPGLASSIYATCDLVSGTPTCWGRLPVAHAYDPTPAPLFSSPMTATQVAIGVASACVITKAGRVICANQAYASPVSVY